MEVCVIVVVGVCFKLVFEAGIVAVEVPLFLVLVLNPPPIRMSSPRWIVHIILRSVLEHARVIAWSL